MKFTIIKSCLARFSGIFALGTPSNIHGTAISYRCAKFGAFVNSVTILTLRDLTTSGGLARRLPNKKKTDQVKLLWDFRIQTDQILDPSRLEVVVLKKEGKAWVLPCC